MTTHFDREIYFDTVRHSLFGGSMTQGQVVGQEAILLIWETAQGLIGSADLRHLAYALATTKHETANEMLPIEEYGKGAGYDYGEIDPETGQVYYGRGFVQLTWRDNYQRATSELNLSGTDDLVWYADKALDPKIAAATMFIGMMQGWFRSPNTLPLYFNEAADDPYGAREIINGDKHIVPSWSGGLTIGKMIAQYHLLFLEALISSSKVKTQNTITLDLKVPPGITLEITINGEPYN